MTNPVHLAPFQDNLEHRTAWQLLGTEAELSPYNWFGPKPDRSFELDENDRFVVISAGPDAATLVGSVSWHTERYGPNPQSSCWNIGINLLGAYRGRGYGYVAQRLLADHLFATTDINRVEASTDVTNIAEQRSLEKAGFLREGVLRGAQFRDDRFHDMIVFSRLRAD